jgi:hypothetical protein
LRRAEGGAKIFGVFRVKNPPLHNTIGAVPSLKEIVHGYIIKETNCTVRRKNIIYFDNIYIISL